MGGLPSSIIKKYGVSKKAWAVYRGSKGKTRTALRRSGGTMAKRTTHRRSSFGGGIMSYVKPVLIGTAGGLIAPRVPVLNTLPFSQAIGGAVACFALGQKSIPKLAIGAASGQYIAPMVNQAIGNRIY